MEARYDLVIVGGGLVGATLALTLLPTVRQYGLSLAMVEPAPWGGQAYQPSFDARSTALSHSSRQLFEVIGVWSELVQRVTPIHHIHVSDQGFPGVTRMEAAQEQVPALGYVAENAWLGQSLYLALSRAEELAILSPAQVEAIKPVGQGMQLTLLQNNEPRVVQAALILMADGGRSGLTDGLGMTSRTTAYQQRAVIANVIASQDHGNVAYERFSRQGPMALLPLNERPGQPSRRFAVVYIQSEQESADSLLQDDAAFLRAIQGRMGFRAGRFVHCGHRDLYPLYKREALETVRQGLALVGNSAHAMHPVAGQGFNLALRGVARLVQAINKGLDKGIGLGDLAMLDSYAQAQRQDQQRVMRYMDLGLKTFANGHFASGVVRNAALLALDLMGPLKTGFVKRATGVGAMPALDEIGYVS